MYVPVTKEARRESQILEILDPPHPLQPPCDRVTSICEKPDEGPGAQFSISDSAGTFLSHLSSLSYSGF